jgi:hypothetical protein
MKQRNPYYKTLTHYKHKVVPSKKKYDRKKKSKELNRFGEDKLNSCDIFDTPKN